MTGGYPENLSTTSLRWEASSNYTVRMAFRTGFPYQGWRGTTWIGWKIWGNAGNHPDCSYRGPCFWGNTVLLMVEHNMGTCPWKLRVSLRIFLKLAERQRLGDWSQKTGELSRFSTLGEFFSLESLETWWWTTHRVMFKRKSHACWGYLS